MALTPVIDTGWWDVRVQAQGPCARVYVDEGVRLIEVVSVKMVPSGQEEAVGEFSSG